MSKSSTPRSSRLGTLVEAANRPSDAQAAVRARRLLTLQLALLPAGVFAIVLLFVLRQEHAGIVIVAFAGFGGIVASYLVSRFLDWQLGGILTCFITITAGIGAGAVSPASGSWPTTTLIATLMASAFLSVRVSALVGTVGILGSTLMVLLSPKYSSIEMWLPPITMQLLSVPVLLLFVVHRRRLEELRFQQLRDDRQRLAAAQRLAKIGSFRIGDSPSDLYLSEQASTLLSEERMREKGLSAFETLVREEDRERLSTALAQLGAGSIDAVELEGLALAEAPERQITMRLRRDPETREVLGSFQDISDRVRFQKEQRALTRALADSERLETLGRMAGGVAHDFNNLLTVIVSATELLKRETPEEPMLEEVAVASDKARTLVRQLMAFAGKQPLQPRIIAPGQVLQSIEPIVKRLVGKEISVFMRGLDGGEEVLADPKQLEQVIINLVDNARDAMPEGGSLHIVLTTERDDSEEPGREQLCISLADTGSGMDAETLDKAFDPFFTTKGRGQGTGLGLATSAGIVRQSGGELTIRSAPGEGTEVRIRLPIVTSSGSREERPDSDAPDAKVPNTVLLVEDEAPIGRILADVLERDGATVHVATDAESAVAMSKELEGKIDLLVTDVRMPGMNGPELARTLREAQPKLPVLFISAYADPMDPLDRRTRFLPKPFGPDHLVSEVSKLSRSAGRPSSRPDS